MNLLLRSTHVTEDQFHLVNKRTEAAFDGLDI